MYRRNRPPCTNLRGSMEPHLNALQPRDTRSKAKARVHDAKRPKCQNVPPGTIQLSCHLCNLSWPVLRLSRAVTCAKLTASRGGQSAWVQLGYAYWKGTQASEGVIYAAAHHKVACMSYVVYCSAAIEHVARTEADHLLRLRYRVCRVCVSSRCRRCVDERSAATPQSSSLVSVMVLPPQSSLRGRQLAARGQSR